MKRTYILLMFASALLAGSDVLDVEPSSQILAEDAFRDERGAFSALHGAYDKLQAASISQDVIVFGDLAADNLIHIGTKKEYRQISEQNIFTENAYVAGMWNDAYDGINRVNNILERLEEVQGMSEEKMQER